MEDKLNLLKESMFIRCKSVLFFNIILRILLILDEVVFILIDDLFMLCFFFCYKIGFF